jgi:thiol-disulfide isomerase/thioredoxin
MKKTLVILSILFSVIGCKQKSEFFEYIITGKVIGKESGELCFFESFRMGDQVVIPFENGTFKYEGKATDILIAGLTFYEDVKNGAFRLHTIIIEPGDISVELFADSIYEKSRTQKGSINLKVQEVNNTLKGFWKEIESKAQTRAQRDSLAKVYGDSIALIIEQNKNDFTGVYLLHRYGNAYYFKDEQLAGLFEKIKKPELRQTKYYKMLYSDWLAKTENINQIGEKAMNFTLPDSTGKIIDFYQLSKEKVTFIELSGSWCGNSTRQTRELLPIYQEYHDKGFEIVTVVFESKYDRWKKWLEKEKFPWINLIELENGNTNDVFFSQQIFTEGACLVDEKGIVVANNLSSAKLNEKLMEKFEPKKYKEYIENKWKLPGGTYILDKEKPINTFEELTKNLSGKAFFIDCWATWCSPCIEQFQYEEPLNEFLKKNDIEMVYISFDSNLDDSEWLSFIKNHKLKGYHMRSNEKFVSDFAQVSDWSHQLPTYIILNHKGEIVEKTAFYPSEKDKLYKQIKTKLNL